MAQDESPWTEVLSRLRRATQGEFEIGHELGRGGMAAVFMAHELSLHRDVAIKVMSPGLLMGDGMVERFRREAITIAHLNHPNIVSVHSVRAAEGLHFFVMRCVQGRSLDQIIGDAGKLPLPIVRSILSQVGSALAYAHRFKVVHRDIKPANILIDEEGNAVVTDFGIAKVAEGPSHTHTGFMVGTPAYMSPEQCTGGQVSGASDQYSLGVVAYEMVSGVPPFTGSTYTVIQAQVEQAPRPLRDLSDCPPELDEAILRMLAKSPGDRWPGMPQALAALGAVALGEDDPLRRKLIELATPAERTSLPAWARRATPKSSPGFQRTPPGRRANLTIVPPPPHLEVGDSFLLVARVQDSQAARLPGTIDWISESPGVLRISANAVATAVAPGSALVRAVSNGNEGRLRITVSPPRADVILVKPLEKPVNVGDEIRLEATPRDKRGRVVTRPISWRSEDDAVATVTLDGTVVARSGGTVRLIAELDEASADITLTVISTRVAALHIGGVPDSVVVGDSFGLTATPLDRWAGALKGRAVSWTVSDVGRAIVTAGGWVVTRSAGPVSLTAVCEGVSASVTLDITEQAAIPEPSEPIPDTPNSAPWSGPDPVWEPRQVAASREHRRRSRGWVLAGGSALLLAAGVMVVGSDQLPGRSHASDTGLAGLDTIRPVQPESGPGEAAGNASAAESITPTPVSAAASKRPQPSSRLMLPGSMSIAEPEPLRVGEVAGLTLTARDSRGRTLRPRATWSSSDPQVAVVDAATGRVESRSAGNTLIVARSNSDSATVSLSVLPEAVASLDISGARALKVGDSVDLSAEARDPAGRVLEGRNVTWISSDPGIALVNAESGMVIATSPGTAEIVATAESASARVRITVLRPPQTARAEAEEVRNRQPVAAPAVNPAAERELLVTQTLAGVEECYSALRTKDVARVEQLYRPATKEDRENLKKLSRILRTQEWNAVIGVRHDGVPRIDRTTATMDFGFALSWKDAFGGHLRSEPWFRAEFTREGEAIRLSSCRMVGSPRL
jgi:serine/threonine protein kinase/uncharacterized protein YjdB